MRKKGRIIALCMALACCIGLGATFAWLTDHTDPVQNTFTVGNIDIDLDETTGDYKMVPATQIAKDPTVTVQAGSEPCWLFVKVEESSNFDSFLTYAIAAGWTQLNGAPGVYYREVAASTADQRFGVLANDQVMVKDAVTKAMLDALTQQTYPTLTFTAYAVQKAGNTTATDAWAKVTP